MTDGSWDEHHARSHQAHGHGHAHAQPSPAVLAGFLAGAPTIPARALDLGCGTGADVVFLAEQGIDAVGLDLSTTALELARERATRHGVEATWLHGDVLQLPLDDASVDLVLDHGCLHHVDVADQPRYAAEVARVLRPGGTLLVREQDHPDHRAHAVSEDSMRAMVADTPLRVRSIVTYDTARGDHTGRALVASFGLEISADD